MDVELRCMSTTTSMDLSHSHSLCVVLCHRENAFQAKWKDRLGAGKGRMPSRRQSHPEQHSDRSMAYASMRSRSIFQCVVRDVSDLEKHVLMLSKQVPNRPRGYDGFQREFRLIEKWTRHHRFMKKYTTALSQVNRHKNRYTNVLPPEESRVKLKTISGSGYINASYINGQINGSDHRYISTQAPMNHTINDFWRMVWETHCAVIVMMTNVVENGCIKCNRYWNEMGTITIGDIKVKSMGYHSITRSLRMRRFEVENTNDSSNKRLISHFQYLDWPDHGIPKDIQSFLDLVKVVDSEEVNSNGVPLIVHCSAGIGRTGTFCAVHITNQVINECVERERRLPPINIFKTVLDLREQRPGMVQTKEQYQFCYLAVLERLKEVKIP